MIIKQSHVLEESIKPRATPGNSNAPELKQIRNLKIAVERKGNCFKQGEATFTHENVVNMINMFIVYKLDMWAR